MITVWHIPRAADPFGGARNSNKVLIALSELGEEHEIRAVRREDIRQASSPYRALNPNGVVPTIEHDGLVLWESGAILRYFADTWPEKNLMPQDVRGRALVQQWVAWEGATFAPALLRLFAAAMATEQDPQARAEAEQGSSMVSAVLDRQLASGAYVCGAFSIADIALGSVVPLLFGLGVDLRGSPNILSWLRKLRTRPAFSSNEIFCADMEKGADQLGG